MSLPYSVRLQNLELQRAGVIDRKGQVIKPRPPMVEGPTVESMAIATNRLQLSGEFPHAAGAMADFIKSLRPLPRVPTT